jgi:class 3 adenylate cyclase/tetratricopeptide (TPR) repeat protein
MQCPNCEHDTPDQGQFCEACGVQVLAICQACGRSNRPAARFCAFCGAFLLSESFSDTAETFGGLMPRHLRERVLTSRQGLLGERKQVTVLFGDAKGSLEHIQRLDPEEAAKWLGFVLRAMIDPVHRYEGTVSRLQGDGIMALFGAPLAQEDHALRACCAALEMLQAAKAIPGRTSEIRVGLHSGEVVVRSISDDLGMHYDAVGLTVHLAGRMEQLAAPDTIWLTGETFRQVQEFVTAKPLGPTRIRGLDHPVDIFELTGLRPVGARWLASTTRELTPFVGREQEIALLLAAIARVRGGQGGVITVVGEPGAGKSRLVHEFLRSESLRDIALLTAGAATYGRNAPYLLVTSLLRAHFEIGDRDSPEAIAKKLRQTLTSVDESLLKVLPVLHGLLDLDVDRGWRELDLMQRRRRIIDAIETLLRALSRDRPALVVLEDLQWIDAETQAIMDELMERVVSARILFLVTHRPEYSNPWIGSDFCHTASLLPLSDESTRTMLGHLLGDALALEQVKRLLVGRTGGNPLFIEESVRSLVETGALSGRPGDYLPTEDSREISVPPTVKAVLATRIDRLKPDSRSVLDVASTIGRRVPVALLREVTNLPEDRLRLYLNELQAADFLYEAQAPPDQEYAFKHALTRDVAYESLLLDARRTLHAQIAAKIELLHAERLDEQIDNLAEHTFQAELWPVAVKHLLRACIRAVSRSAPRAAVALFERGLIALDHLPEGAARAKAGVDLRLVALNALIPLGDHAPIVRHLTDAESLAQSLGDNRRLGLVYSQLTVAFWMSGEHGRALKAGEQALAAANALGHQQSQIGARFALGMVHHALGNLDLSIAIQRELLTDFAPEMDKERFGWVGYPGVLIRTFLAGALVETGNFDEAAAHLDTGCQIADELGHAYSRAMIYAIVGQLLMERGQLDKAAELLDRMLALCREEEVWAMYPVIAARLIAVYARSGRTAEAIAILDHARQPSVYRKGATYTWLYLFLAAGEAYLGAGRLEDARAYADRAEALARRNSEQAHLAAALKLRGDVMAATDGGAHDAVTETYREAIALAEPRGMRPLLARIQFSLGAFLARRNFASEAARHLAAAAELCCELGIASPSSPAGEEKEAAPAPAIGSIVDRTVFQGRLAD